MSTLVVGGGWAGLATATTLSQQQQPVTLLEAAGELGGRARLIDDGHWPIDNGQHFMLGCYHDALAWFERLGLPPHHYLRRNLLRLEIRSAQHEVIALHTPNVAAPMHLLWGMMRMKGLGLHERGTVFRLVARLLRSDFKISQDRSLFDWLLQNGQTRRLISFFWQPLSLLLLNTPIKQASTEVFLNLLQHCFARDRGDSDLLFMHKDLNRELPRRAASLIEQAGGTVALTQPVTGLIIDQGHIKGVRCQGRDYPADQVVLATPSWITAELCSPHAALQGIAQALDGFDYQPSTTVYLRYPADCRPGRDMLGMVNMSGHWLFDRRLCGEDGVISVVIYGSGPHEKMPDSSLIEQVTQDVARLFPHWPRPDDAQLMREPRATLHCPPAINARRPDIHTPIEGLWLAGDYIRSSYPARLESAVKSGMACARAVLSSSIQAGT